MSFIARLFSSLFGFLASNLKKEGPQCVFQETQDRQTESLIKMRHMHAQQDIWHCQAVQSFNSRIFALQRSILINAKNAQAELDRRCIVLEIEELKIAIRKEEERYRNQVIMRPGEELELFKKFRQMDCERVILEGHTICSSLEYNSSYKTEEGTVRCEVNIERRIVQIKDGRYFLCALVTQCFEDPSEGRPIWVTTSLAQFRDEELEAVVKHKKVGLAKFAKN